MADNLDFEKLVTQAQGGNDESMGILAKRVEPRLRCFIYRTTLDNDLTNDLLQESLLEMVRSLKNLGNIKSFWPWLYRVASSKVNQFYRAGKRHGSIKISRLEDSLLERILSDDSQEAVSSLVRRELGELVIRATSKLKPIQRSVVSLRCYEGLSYAEIGESIGCDEMSARVHFFRAKQSLKKQLSRRGFSKSSLLLAFILFGKLTASTEAAALSITVAPELLHGLGFAASLLGAAKVYFGRVSAALAAVFIVSFVCWSLWPEDVLSRSDVRSVHFLKQGVIAPTNTSSSSSSVDISEPGIDEFKTQAFFETWLYFPDGPDGAVFKREQRWGDIDKTKQQCSWFQDGNGNYYYFHDEQMSVDRRKIYISNSPLWQLLLSTDDSGFTEFMLKMCNHDPRLKYIRDSRSGLLVEQIDNRVAAVKDFTTSFEYNTIGQEFFEYDLPAGIEVVDHRDAMHKRGWTYFRVDGYIGEDKVSGEGRIPFVYYSSEEHRPWLRLRVGDKFEIIDSIHGAYLIDGNGAVKASYASGSFFKGLGRPWMGIRAYDIVRRDACEKRIRFKYEQQELGKGFVTLFSEGDYSRTQVEYLISMEKDIINEISLRTSDGFNEVEGFLSFSYFEQIDGVGKGFAEPTAMDSDIAISKSAGADWLLQLAEGKLLN